MYNSTINNTGIGATDIWNGATVWNTINATAGGQVLYDVDIDVLINDTLTGLAARNGFTPVAGSVMLLTNQTDTSQNGIYSAASGAWSRYQWTSNGFVVNSAMTTYSQLGYNYNHFRVSNGPSTGSFYQIFIQNPQATFGNSTVKIVASLLTNVDQVPVVWTSNTLVRKNQLVTVPLNLTASPYFFIGEIISSNSARKTSATFDTTEAAFWTLRSVNSNIATYTQVDAGSVGNVKTLTSGVTNLLSLTLINPGMYILFASIRVRVTPEAGKDYSFFISSATATSNYSTAINNSIQNYHHYDAIPTTVTGIDYSNTLVTHYINTTANKTIYLNFNNAGSASVALLSSSDGYTSLSAIQLR